MINDFTIENDVMAYLSEREKEVETMKREIAGRLRVIVDDMRHELMSLDEEHVSLAPAPGKWSAKQILGHLIDSALNNHQRFVRAQAENDLHFPGYDQDFWVNTNAYAGRDWNDIVVLWRRLNCFIADVIVNIRDDKLFNQVMIGDNEPVTLAVLLEDYVGHVEHHLAQIRALYRREE